MYISEEKGVESRVADPGGVVPDPDPSFKKKPDLDLAMKKILGSYPR